ncbi:M48 family metalloprotease [Treponema primitia]|uniref:M48 family metalloprotease n=1 Tax=Treponema primitia TaxID=88058 RepID=UPI00397FD530
MKLVIMMNTLLNPFHPVVPRISRFIPFYIILVFSTTILSCTGVAKAIGDRTDEMEDPKGANALSRSALSIERALEYITPEQEYFIGRAVGANILTNYQIYNENPDLTLYLNLITTAIVIHSSKPEIYNGYHTAILDSDEINAFATPGGHIFITRGFLAYATSEDDLAAVLAQQIAHIQLQHGIEVISSNRVVSAIAETSSSVASLALSELAGVLDEAAEEIVTALREGYSQEQQYKADNRAVVLLADAGYEPSSLLTMLQALEHSQLQHPGGFNQTHPTPEERIANVQKYLRQYRDKVLDTRTYREPRFGVVKQVL